MLQAARRSHGDGGGTPVDRRATVLLVHRWIVHSQLPHHRPFWVRGDDGVALDRVAKRAWTIDVVAHLYVVPGVVRVSVDHRVEVGLRAVGVLGWPYVEEHVRRTGRGPLQVHGDVEGGRVCAGLLCVDVRGADLSSDNEAFAPVGRSMWEGSVAAAPRLRRPGNLRRPGQRHSRRRPRGSPGSVVTTTSSARPLGHEEHCARKRSSAFPSTHPPATRPGTRPVRGGPGGQPANP